MKHCFRKFTVNNRDSTRAWVLYTNDSWNCIFGILIIITNASPQYLLAYRALLLLNHYSNFFIKE